MRKLLATIVLSAATSAAHALPITFSDVINPNYLFNGNGGANATQSFSHNLLDDGFNAATDTITAASLTLRFSDESADAAPELVAFIFDGLPFGTQTITSGGATFVVTFTGLSLMALVAEGALDMTLNNAGSTTTSPENRSDFLFLDSTLTVDATRAALSPPSEPSTPVPEPGSLALTGFGLAAAALERRKRATDRRPQ